MGVMAGRVAARWASATLEHRLYGVRPGDWPTIAVAALSVLVVALAPPWCRRPGRSISRRPTR